MNFPLAEFFRCTCVGGGQNANAYLDVGLDKIQNTNPSVICTLFHSKFRLNLYNFEGFFFVMNDFRSDRFNQ